MVRLGLAMVVGVAPALVSWWRGQGSWLQSPLVSPTSEKPLMPMSPDKPLRAWTPRRSPSLSDCLESSDDEDSSSARSIVCLVRPKVVSLQSFEYNCYHSVFLVLFIYFGTQEAIYDITIMRFT